MVDPARRNRRFRGKLSNANNLISLALLSERKNAATTPRRSALCSRRKPSYASFSPCVRAYVRTCVHSSYISFYRRRGGTGEEEEKEASALSTREGEIPVFAIDYFNKPRASVYGKGARRNLVSRLPHPDYAQPRSRDDATYMRT